MKRYLKLLGLAAALGIAALVTSVVVTVRGTAPIQADLSLDGVQVVKDGFVSAFIVDLGPGAVALVDAGNDPDAKAILAALARRGLGPDAVRAILLTHGDLDHVRGAPRFPAAQVMALGSDAAVAEGRERRGVMRLLPARPTGVHVARTLQDGETVDLEGVAVRVLAVPGHSAGSAAYLARGVLFMGDAAEATRAGKLEHGWWFTNSDTEADEGSLMRLADRLRPEPGAVRAIACAHSGVLQRGLSPLLEWAAARR